MVKVTTRSSLFAELTAFREAGKRIGLVPTMGNLHAGHISLVEMIREHCDVCVASVFVNPTQFGEGEDLDSYPRTPEADLSALSAAGCDLVFAPETEAIYPNGPQHTTEVRVPVVSAGLCGAHRPGHFDGVSTVVAILLSLVRPQCAVFGRKDFQQLKVIEKLVCDLGLQVEVIGAPIVREADGLAMSSRNQYLSKTERKRAATIYRVLTELKDQIVSGGWSLDDATAAAVSRLTQADLKPEYLAIRRAADLRAAEPADTHLVALAAVRLGRARLIDNIEFERA